MVRETPFAAVPFTVTVYVPAGVPGCTLLGALPPPPPHATIPIVSANSSTPPDASLAQRAAGGAVHAACRAANHTARSASISSSAIIRACGSCRAGPRGDLRTKGIAPAAVVVTLTVNCPAALAVTFTEGGVVAGVVLTEQVLRGTGSVQARAIEPVKPADESS
jgi:hypothetical protein